MIKTVEGFKDYLEEHRGRSTTRGCWPNWRRG